MISSRKAACGMNNTKHMERATTVAFDFWLVMSDISPNTSPASSRAIGVLPATTAASPDMRIKSPAERVPSSMKRVFCGASMN